jgi:hypothetical protein
MHTCFYHYESLLRIDNFLYRSVDFIRVIERPSASQMRAIYQQLEDHDTMLQIRKQSNVQNKGPQMQVDKEE